MKNRIVSDVYKVCLHVKGYGSQCLCKSNIPTIDEAFKYAYEFKNLEILVSPFDEVTSSQFDYVEIIKCKDAHDRYLETTIATINCN